MIVYQILSLVGLGGRSTTLG